MKHENPFSIASKMLNEVIFNNVIFSICLKSYAQKHVLDKEQFSTASVLVGCELRHHLLFKELVEESFGELPNDCSIAFYLVLSNNVFVKTISEEEANLFLLSALIDNGVHIEKEKLDDFFNKVRNSETLISEKYEKDTYDFLSLRYNTPRWLVKTWSKNYKNLVYRILKANTKKPLNTFRLNPLVPVDVVSEDHLFKKSFVDEILVYEGKAPTKRQTYFQNGLIFPIGFKFFNFIKSFIIVTCKVYASVVNM